MNWGTLVGASQAELELAVCARMLFDCWSSCISSLSAGILDMQKTRDLRLCLGWAPHLVKRHPVLKSKIKE